MRFIFPVVRLPSGDAKRKVRASATARHPRQLEACGPAPERCGLGVRRTVLCLERRYLRCHNVPGGERRGRILGDGRRGRDNHAGRRRSGRQRSGDGNAQHGPKHHPCLYHRHRGGESSGEGRRRDTCRVSSSSWYPHDWRLVLVSCRSVPVEGASLCPLTFYCRVKTKRGQPSAPVPPRASRSTHPRRALAPPSQRSAARAPPAPQRH